MKIMRFVFLLFPLSLCAQQMLSLRGEIEPADIRVNIELFNRTGHQPTGNCFANGGRFECRGLETSDYELRVLSESGELLRLEMVQVHEYMTPLTIRLNIVKVQRAITGVVSAKQLMHEKSREFKRAATYLQKSGEMIRAHRLVDARKQLMKAIEADPLLALAYATCWWPI